MNEMQGERGHAHMQAQSVVASRRRQPFARPLRPSFFFFFPFPLPSLCGQTSTVNTFEKRHVAAVRGEALHRTADLAGGGGGGSSVHICIRYMHVVFCSVQYSCSAVHVLYTPAYLPAWQTLVLWTGVQAARYPIASYRTLHCVWYG